MRYSSLIDFYRGHFIYRLSRGGEAVESALAVFARTLRHRAELQTVALEDISTQLQALRARADAARPDAAKIHEALRDLVRVFRGFTEHSPGRALSRRMTMSWVRTHCETTTALASGLANRSLNSAASSSALTP